MIYLENNLKILEFYINTNLLNNKSVYIKEIGENYISLRKYSKRLNTLYIVNDYKYTMYSGRLIKFINYAVSLYLWDTSDYYIITDEKEFKKEVKKLKSTNKQKLITNY